MKNDWTINALADETGLDRRTIKRLFTAAGKEPPYTLRDFVEALQAGASGRSEMVKQRLKKLTAEARIAEAEAGKIEGSLVSAEGVFHIYANLCVSIRQVIKASGLSEVEKHEVLKQLREISIEDLIAEPTANADLQA